MFRPEAFTHGTVETYNMAQLYVRKSVLIHTHLEKEICPFSLVRNKRSIVKLGSFSNTHTPFPFFYMKGDLKGIKNQKTFTIYFVTVFLRNFTFLRIYYGNMRFHLGYGPC
jgi:hypothetical protein